MILGVGVNKGRFPDLEPHLHHLLIVKLRVRVRVRVKVKVKVKVKLKNLTLR